MGSSNTKTGVQGRGVQKKPLQGKQPRNATLSTPARNVTWDNYKPGTGTWASSTRKPGTASDKTYNKQGKPERSQTAPAISNRKHYRVEEEPVNKRRVRDDLKTATAGDDIQVLKNCMDVFHNEELEDAGDFSRAAERLEFLKMRKELRDACVRRNAVVLGETMRKIESSRYRMQLKPYLDRAHYIVQDLGNSSQFKHIIPGINGKTISEIRRYTHPPLGVHETMIATYLILGYPEEILKDWMVITALMGRHGNESLQYKMSVVEKKPVDRAAAATAKQYLGTHSLDFVRQKSNGAAAFYVWAARKVGASKR